VLIYGFFVVTISPINVLLDRDRMMHKIL